MATVPVHTHGFGCSPTSRTAPAVLKSGYVAMMLDPLAMPTRETPMK